MSMNTFRFAKRIAPRPGQGVIFPTGTLRYTVNNPKKIRSGESHRFQLPIYGVVFDTPGTFLVPPTSPSSEQQAFVNTPVDKLVLQTGLGDLLKVLDERDVRTGMVSRDPNWSEHFKQAEALLPNNSITLKLGNQFFALREPNPASMYIFAKKWGVFPSNMIFVSTSFYLLSRMKASGVLTCLFRTENGKGPTSREQLSPKADDESTTIPPTSSSKGRELTLPFVPDLTVESYESLTDSLLSEKMEATYIHPQHFRDTEIQALLEKSTQKITFSQPSLIHQ